MMDMGGLSWALMNIIGPLLLAVVLAWVLLRNRKPRADEVDRTEKATHDLYDEEEATRRREDDGVA
ncbi:hypothetical protein [Sphingosinicella rhizophila]|uniref:Uncharacterized protein n=1 Tax=Sphingosinicella rhizophila TaxID=3050082 RepID=A0ABU3Q7G4_9SPHN|nr:hypothetical protein [Sphingosinicella sp. GR2756]MDT9599343.1 hypothetical protein [Sphingosinicella sp. GR2756]